jgi:hypothetical protein
MKVRGQDIRGGLFARPGGLTLRIGSASMG